MAWKDTQKANINHLFGNTPKDLEKCAYVEIKRHVLLELLIVYTRNDAPTTLPEVAFQVECRTGTSSFLRTEVMIQRAFLIT